MPNRLEETDWESLLGRINDGKCTPFIGAGVCAGKIPFGSQIASEWAEKYDYPMEDSHDLIRVAQFVAVTKDIMIPKEEICKKIRELVKEVTTESFKEPDEPHGVLADLPLPIYITTNYDDFMVQALKSRGKKPVQEICRWNKDIKQPKQTSSDYVPTPKEPLVFHLHGSYEEPMSLVLTEDDYLSFHAAISKKPDLIPRSIQAAMVESSLLFLGYRIADWDFHVLLQILSVYLKKSKRAHLSVQLVPGDVFVSRDVTETQKEKAQKYLDRYFQGLSIQVYLQGCHDFAKELNERWKAPCPEPEPIDPTKPWCETNEVSILFLAADPTNETHLRLGEEFREIKEELKLAKFRDKFRLEPPQLSVRSNDIIQALLDTQPQIVHFSGHGTSSGELCFENMEGESCPIEPDALAALFKKFSGQVNCIVLNACYSEIQATAIAKHIKYVIGMNQEIGDKAAIAFSTGFYGALGGGCSIEDAYDFGCLQIRLLNIPGYNTPVLIILGVVKNHSLHGKH